MPSTAEEVRELVNVGAAEILTCEVCPGEDPVLEIWPVLEGEAASLLRSLQELVAETGRWPLLAVNFDRYKFWESEFAYFVADGLPVTPAAITERSKAVDLDELVNERAGRSDYSLEELLIEMEHEPERFHLPTELEPWPEVYEELQIAIEAGEVSDMSQAMRWILEWKLLHLEETEADIDNVRKHQLDGTFEDRTYQILLLPKSEPWRATAFIPFFSSSGEFSTALLKRWFDRWGAKPVAHHGTMMSFVVDNPPETQADASQLAWEHYALAPCITDITFIDLALYARALIGHNRWFLHEKP